VYRQCSVVGKLEDDHLEQVAGCVGTDHEHLRRVMVIVHVDDDDRAGDDVFDRLVRDAVTSCRSVDLHTALAYYTNTLDGASTQRRSSAARP
jgi:hypothetical protein